MPTRHDVSEVPAQGGYIAKQCPVIAHNRHDPTILVEPVPVSDATQLMFDRGNEFEDKVFAQLVALHGGAVVVDRTQRRADREARTMAAMEAGAWLIIGGRLPPDVAGRRVGEPDVLARHTELEAGRWSYVPVDVKHHLTLDEHPGHAGVLVSSLEMPGFSEATPREAWKLRRHEGDALQLAHYQRMLEACGHGAPEAVGAIIGKELLVVWYDLDEPLWRSGGRLRTTMERYDFEFEFRLDIISVAQRRGADPSLDPLVVPVQISDCAGCEWWALCGPVLEESDDVSLLPRIGWPQWRDLREGGINSQEELAHLDWTTASLIQQGVDLRTYVENAPTFDPGTEVLEVIGKRRKKQASVLAEAGFHTAQDIERIDQATVDVAYARGDKPISGLANQIDMARARIGNAPAYRKRGIETVTVPRADVEIDIDMENSIDGSAYLWGALVADGDTDPVYKSFVSWEPTDAEGMVRQQVFADFWDWLMGLIDATENAGRTIAVYCYSRQAEETHMRQGVADDDTATTLAVEDFIASDRWIDMRSVFESQLITGDKVGLKVVANLAGFTWRDEDPGGAQSMVWYQEAIVGDKQAQQRLLAYNEDDVRATKALREWMESSDHPSIARWS